MNSTLKAQNHWYSIESSVQSAGFDSSALVIEFMAVLRCVHGQGQVRVLFLVGIFGETKQSHSANVWMLLAYEEEKEVSGIYLRV